MSTTARSSSRSTGAILLEFLGSMNLAVTLLVIVAVSSVIGTVLKQNEPYQDYVLKFGSFWFEVYKKLGLFDVYSALWFLLILGFLLVSTSVCVYRNGPAMLRDMRAFRENIAEKSLRFLHDKAEWTLPQPASAVTATIAEHLASYGYRIRMKEHGDGTMLAAMSGAANRLGYLLTHIGIVVICVGALVDGNLPLKAREMTGRVRPETRTLMAAQVPEISRLNVDNLAFRGLIDIPEGSLANHVDVKLRDGYLLQDLPFSIQVKAFRVEQYPSGMPKSFESDLVVYDKDLTQPLRQTISVNHPLIYKGYGIFLASFGDGGSKLQFRAWPLAGSQTPFDTHGDVSKTFSLATPQGPMTVELEDFHLYNVKPAQPGTGKKFMDFGPSFTFKLRNASGIAREFETYMQPAEQKGRLFYITGMRDTPNADYRYVRIPADASGGIGRFMSFMASVHDPRKRAAAAAQVAHATLTSGAMAQDPQMQQRLAAVIARLLEKFSSGGFDAVTRYMQVNLPPDRLKEAATAYVGLLQKTLAVVYGEVPPDGGVKRVAASAADDDSQQFFQDAVDALGVLPQYGSPYYLQLTSFKQIQASGLQITRSPGKNIVYLGCGMLIIGLFVMFYLPQRRLWVLVKTSAEATRVLFAGAANRDRISGFAEEFNKLRQTLDARLSAL